jgi:hypothetical protein
MPRSRALVVLAVAFALAGAASVGMSGIAHATPSGPSGPSAPTMGWQGQATTADTITINPVVQVTNGSGDGQPGQSLSVTADSTTALTSMTVHLLDATSDQEALELKMSLSADATGPGQSTWTSPLISAGTSAPDLPLGTYNVAVDATDAGGTSVSYQPAGTFAFQDTPSIAPDPANLVITHDNRTPTISGTVSTLAPGATNSEPYQGTVMLEDSLLGDQTLPIDGKGHYTYTFQHPEPGEIFSIVVLPSATLGGGATATAQFDAQADPVTLSAGLSATTVTYGGKVTVGGTLSYQPGGSYRPLPGQTVRIYDRPGAPSPVATAVTNSSGGFTATLPKQAASVHWVVQAGGPAAGPYLGSASLTLPMKVNLPTAVSGFEVALSMFGQLSYRGCLALPAGVPGRVPSLSGLAIQYAAGPNGPWHTLGTVPRQNTGQCGNGGWKFSGALAARLNYAYYRAWYPGATAAGTGYLAVASGRVLVWKYLDRITGFSVSPPTVHKDGKLTVKGQLEYHSGTWRGYAGQRVYIILRGAGCSDWCYIVVAGTDSSGRFSASFADPESATWSAEFFGDSAHLATLAPLIYVRAG